MKKQYFCNPLNMDYRYQFIEDMRSGEDKISREAADPSMILFQGKYYVDAKSIMGIFSLNLDLPLELIADTDDEKLVDEKFAKYIIK